jgi:hypothetical protein
VGKGPGLWRAGVHFQVNLRQEAPCKQSVAGHLLQTGHACGRQVAPTGASSGWVRCRLHRAIADYSLFMGSIAGLCFNAGVFGAWLGAGAAMGYGNPNWMLIIGTYTGEWPQVWVTRGPDIDGRCWATATECVAGTWGRGQGRLAKTALVCPCAWQASWCLFFHDALLPSSAGLVGFFDACILRYTMGRMHAFLEGEIAALDAADARLGALLNVDVVPFPEVRLSSRHTRRRSETAALRLVVARCPWPAAPPCVLTDITGTRFPCAAPK